MGDIRTKFPRKSAHTPDSTYYKSPDQDEDCIIFRGWDSAAAIDDDSQSESGVSSPTLWGSNSRTSPQFHRPRNRSLSPTSRIQAIARGQQELMEMVRNMPESSYELSLKDLVEHHLTNSKRQQDGDCAAASLARDDSSSETSFRRDSSKTRSETRGLVTRSRSVDSGGFYLKMFLPLPFGQVSAKKKTNLRTDSGLSGGSRVSPKPPPVEKDWWRKRSAVAGGENEGSISGGSMMSSGSSNSTSSERSNSRNSESQGSCWFCISPMRSKDRE
ncbi:uncharacterized protein LOC120075766 [Benincasa hispida]|uniref:uncharacterized protein LOC120075766 n=1 Tax=Benincasa hispida TaxID=102211 RepID=UPI001902B022|nr:uncharacterized protein LOC120075766 [Benincasa hispida]